MSFNSNRDTIQFQRIIYCYTAFYSAWWRVRSQIFVYVTEPLSDQANANAQKLDDVFGF